MLKNLPKSEILKIFANHEFKSWYEKVVQID